MHLLIACAVLLTVVAAADKETASSNAIEQLQNNTDLQVQEIQLNNFANVLQKHVRSKQKRSRRLKRRSPPRRKPKPRVRPRKQPGLVLVTRAPKRPSCFDMKKRTRKPRYPFWDGSINTCRDHDKKCPQMKSLCNDWLRSRSIRKRCPNTCGYCLDKDYCSATSTVAIMARELTYSECVKRSVSLPNTVQIPVPIECCRRWSKNPSTTPPKTTPQVTQKPNQKPTSKITKKQTTILPTTTKKQTTPSPKEETTTINQIEESKKQDSKTTQPPKKNPCPPSDDLITTKEMSSKQQQRIAIDCSDE